MLEQTVTTGTTDIQVALANTGAVSVQTGTLEFDGGGTSTAGTFTVASGATLDFGGGTFTLSGDAFSGAGLVQVSGGTTNITGATIASGLAVTGGALSIAASSGTAASLTQTGGSIAGAGTLTVSDAATFSGSNYDQETGTGTTLLQGDDDGFRPSYIALDGGRVLENAGTFNVTGNGDFYLGYNFYGAAVGGGTIQNDSGGTFDFQTASYIGNGTGTNTFVNAGMLEQTVTTGTTDIEVALANTGAVSVQTGTLEFDGGGTSTAGTFTVASGATLDFGGGTFTLSGDAFSGAGLVQVSGGATNITGATIASGLAVTGGALSIAASSGTAASLTQTGGLIAGAGTLTVSGAATFSGSNYDQETGTGTTLLQGTTTDSSPSYIALDGGRVLENAGTFNVTGNGDFYLGYNFYGAAVGGGTIQNDTRQRRSTSRPRPTSATEPARTHS